MVNEFRFGYTRFFNSAGRELAFKRDVVTELGIPGLKGGDPVTWGIPSVGLTDYSGFGDDSEGPYANDNNSLQFIDNFSWIRGKHSFRFGGEIRRDEYNQVGNQFARGAFLFDPDATSISGATAATRVGRRRFRRFPAGLLQAFRSCRANRTAQVPEHELRDSMSTTSGR